MTPKCLIFLSLHTCWQNQGRPPNGCRKQNAKLPGASVRNSAHGKGHEEGGFGICKGGIEPQETPCSRASTPNTRVYLLYCFMLSPTPLTLWGAVPHWFSQRRSKRSAPSQYKFLGVTRVFQLTDSSEGYLACLYRFVRPHVIVYSLPTVRSMRCSRLTKGKLFWKVRNH